jgi:hypothetical protein
MACLGLSTTKPALISKALWAEQTALQSKLTPQSTATRPGTRTSGALSSAVTRYLFLRRDTTGSQFPLQSQKTPRPIPAPSSFQLDVRSSPAPSSNLAPALSSLSTQMTPPFFQPPGTGRNSFSMSLRPTFTSGPSQALPAIPLSNPNYNILLPRTLQDTAHKPPISSAMNFPQHSTAQALVATPLHPESTLVPSKPSQLPWVGSSKKLSKDDWGDFDPLS